MSKAIELYKAICKFYQSLDHNGAFLDDFDERIKDIENFKNELQIMENITNEWHEQTFLTDGESDWIKKDINTIKTIVDNIK